MINVAQLLQKRLEFSFGQRSVDEWLEYITESQEDQIAIITLDNLNGLNRKNEVYRNTLFAKYNIEAMFDLSDPLVGTNVNLYLYIFTTQMVEQVKTGIYKTKINKKMKNQRDDIKLIRIISEFPEDYSNYISFIEKWINLDIEPEDKENYSFCNCNIKYIDKNCLSPKCYSKQVQNIRNVLKREETFPLEDLAEVIRPKQIKEEGKVITVPSLQYPLNYKKLKEGNKTNTPLIQGDIIFKCGGNKNIYYLEDAPKEEIHAAQNDIIIRTKDVSAEYLYVYLKSETAEIIMQSKLQGAVIQRLTFRTISKMPVIKPKKSEEEYKEICYLINHPKQIHLPIDINSLKEYYKRFSSHALKIESQKNGTVEDILNLELVSNINSAHAEAVKDMISDDIKELNDCFRVKAYKATLILAGSILEAVLIEWLSEIDGKDYFYEEYYVVDKHTGRNKRADLIDYIDVIKEIKKPSWMNEANMAHKIRKKRNLVHAKLGINSEDINEETCRQVIQYLKEVLKTRGK